MMVTARLSVFAILALVSAEALAVMPRDFAVQTTRELVKLCSVDEDDPMYVSAKGFCLGFVGGVWDYHRALTAGPGFKPLACPEPGVTRDQLADALVEWAEAARATLDTEEPVQGVMRALIEKWPCSGK